MSSTTPETATRTDVATRGGSGAGTSERTSEQGKTVVADVVVAKIAGMATRDVSGVHDLGGGASRAFGAIRERIPGATSNVSQGVTVEVGEQQTAVDLDIVVDYGVAIPDLTDAIRRNVISAIERMTGLEVIEVNITVDDIHLPGDEDQRDETSQVPAEPRVQ